MEENRRERRMWLTAVVAVLLPVRYVLSIGPVAWVMYWGEIEHAPIARLVNIFYGPLRDLVELTGTELLLFEFLSWFVPVAT